MGGFLLRARRVQSTAGRVTVQAAPRTTRRMRAGGTAGLHGRNPVSLPRRAWQHTTSVLTGPRCSVPRRVDPEVAHRKARVAGLVKVGADPERIAEARAALKAAGLEARIRRDVTAWPPLSPAVRADLAVLLLRAAGNDHAAT